MPETSKGAIAITGATGFIGRTLLDRLAESGWRLRALTRSGRVKEHPLVEPVRGSLESFAALERLVDGVEVVIHCAGAVRGASYADFARVNVTGLENLLIAIRCRSRPPRLIHLSSLAARQPQLSWYAASKNKGEELLEKHFPELSWTVLRPPAVYGPGDKEMLPVFRLMARGVAPVPGTGRSRFSLLHVTDLAAAVEMLLAGAGKGRIFELHDGKERGYDWFEVIEVVSGLRGKRVRPVRIPLACFYPPAWLNQFAARIFNLPRPMLTPGKVREIAWPEWVCDNAAFARETGWRPRVDLRRGLAALLAW